MSEVNKREELKKAYPHSKAWAERVNKMPENQVVAVYLRLKSKGKVAMKRRAPSVSIRLLK